MRSVRFARERPVHLSPNMLDVQADHLSALSTRVIVPLRKPDTGSQTTTDLNPRFELASTRVHGEITHIASVPARR